MEHLLRNVKDATVSTLTTEVSRMATGLSGLQVRLAEIQAYLGLVLERKIPVNHDIIYQLQVCGPSLRGPYLSISSMSCPDSVTFYAIACLS